MKLYVLSTQYLPLVNVDFSDHLTPVTQKSISTEDLKTVFYKSHEYSMIACSILKDAFLIAKTQLEMHCTDTRYIDNKRIQYFATPVIYTMDIEDPLPNETTLTTDDLIHYMDKNSIPLYEYSNDEAINVVKKSQIAICLEEKPELQIRKLDELDFANVSEASYFDPLGNFTLNNLSLNDLSCEPPKAAISVRPQSASFRLSHFAPKTHKKITAIGGQPPTTAPKQDLFTLV